MAIYRATRNDIVHAGLVKFVKPVSRRPSNPVVSAGLSLILDAPAFISSTSQLTQTFLPWRKAPSGLATQTTKLPGKEAVLKVSIMAYTGKVGMRRNDSPSSNGNTSPCALLLSLMSLLTTPGWTVTTLTSGCSACTPSKNLTAPSLLDA